jgi:hypothetical protein
MKLFGNTIPRDIGVEKMQQGPMRYGVLRWNHAIPESPQTEGSAPVTEEAE